MENRQVWREHKVLWLMLLSYIWGMWLGSLERFHLGIWHFILGGLGTIVVWRIYEWKKWKIKEHGKKD